MYFAKVRGRVVGPLSKESILEMISRGQIGRESSLSFDKNDWFPAEHRDELFPKVQVGHQGGDSNDFRFLFSRSPQQMTGPPPLGQANPTRMPSENVSMFPTINRESGLSSTYLPPLLQIEGMVVFALFFLLSLVYLALTTFFALQTNDFLTSDQQTGLIYGLFTSLIVAMFVAIFVVHGLYFLKIWSILSSRTPQNFSLTSYRSKLWFIWVMALGFLVIIAAITIVLLLK